MPIEAILQEIEDAYARIKQAEASAQYWYEHYLDGLKESFNERLAAIEDAFRQAEQEAAAAYQARMNGARAKATAAPEQADGSVSEAESAFPWIMAGWDDPAWRSYAPATEAPSHSCVRIGRLDLADADGLPPLPALAQFLGRGHLFITVEEDASAAAQQLLQSIVLRLLVSSRPGSLRLTLLDPTGSGANLATFMRLPPALRGAKVYSRPEEIDQQLKALADHVESVIQTRLLNLYPTIEEYNAHTTSVSVPYQIIALSGFPAGFDERMAEQLLAIARNGPRAGVYIVTSLSPASPPPRNFEIEQLTRLGTTLRFTAADRMAWDDPEFKAYPVVPDSMPPAEQAFACLHAISQTAQQASTSLPMERIIIPETERWRGSTLECLHVSIGVVSSGDAHCFDMGRDQDVVHHGLIGGTTSSGKSNLLHVLIAQLALRYAPEELELYLVDFKAGVEFQHYASLPHARRRPGERVRVRPQRPASAPAGDGRTGS